MQRNKKRRVQSGSRQITREEKMKCWMSLEPNVRDWIIKLLNGNELKFERYDKWMDENNNNSDEKNKPGGNKGGIQQRLF